MKKYDTYKDSGIEWLREIPNKWDIVKLKHVVESIETGKTPSTSNDLFFENGSIDWYSPGDFTSLKLQDANRKITKKAVEDYKLTLYPKDTILLIGIGATLGKVAIVDRACYSNQQINAIIPSEKINSIFALYYLDSIKDIIRNESSSSTMAILNQSKTKDLILVLPSPIEQAKIAQYLDHKTTKIDTLIEKKEQLVEKLTLKRQAIINEAVTKGLNPDVPMKDSGIEWLGEIAESWETKKIKHSCYVKGRIGWKGLKTDDYLDEGYAYLVTGTDFTGQVVDWSRCHYIDKERYDEDPYIQLKNGDVLLTKDGTIGKVTLVDNLNKPASLNSGIFLIRSLIKELDTRFLYWVLNSNIFKVYIDLTSTGATIKHLYQNVFVEFEYVLPPLKEQLKIEEFLFHINKEFEDTIEKINTSIDKLKLYRQSLISEAVTGKIDLRDWKQTDNK